MICVLREPRAVRELMANWHRQGVSVALVPTMCFLHGGHAALIREARSRADVVAVSLFVNPAQFGPQEDLARYPRDFEKDLALCTEAGVGLIYAPTASAVYPQDFQTWVQVTEVSQGLCAAARPQHFRGVATVVAKLFGLFRPRTAVFGEKDYQQLRLVFQLNADLELGVEIVAVPTVREPDGLAISSRNVFLTPEERYRAGSLSRGLFAAQDAAAKGLSNVAELRALIVNVLESAEANIEYVEIRNAQSLEPISSLSKLPARALVAARFGTTRLIDNVALHGGTMR